jgi:hypothetical protein
MADKEDYNSEQLFLQKVDRILSGDVEVSVADMLNSAINISIPSPSVIAFTNRKTKVITLNFPYIHKISKDIEDFIISLKGFNYHELGHILFTQLPKKIRDNHYLKDLWNAIEDGRIELLFSSIYPTTKLYFMNCVMTYFAENLKLPPENFLCLYARKDICPTELLHKVEGRFTAKYTLPITQQIKVLIDRFIRTDNLDEHGTIIEKIYNLMKGKAKNPNELDTQQPFNIIINPFGSVIGKFSETTPNSKKSFSSKQKKAIEKLRELLKANKGKQQIEIQITKEEIKGQLSEQIQNDIKVIYKENVSVSAGFGSDGTQKQPIVITDRDRNLSLKISNIIKLLRNDLQFGYIKNQKLGKLNIRSAMSFKRTANTRLFKKYIPDKLDKSKLGIMILLDCSGSMQDSQVDKCLHSAWIISDALNRTKNFSSVIEYSDDNHKVIKGFKDKGYFARCFSGGTNPHSALMQTEKLMRNLELSDKVNNWLVFIFTDGCWAGGEEEEKCHDIIEKLGKKAETILIDLRESGSEISTQTHSCKEQFIIKDVAELMPIFQKLTLNLQRKVYQRLSR